MGILKNREKIDFGTEIFWAKQGGDLARHFDLQPISAKKGRT